MSGDGKEKVSDTSKFSRNLNVPDIFIDKKRPFQVLCKLKKLT